MVFNGNIIYGFSWIFMDFRFLYWSTRGVCLLLQQAKHTHTIYDFDLFRFVWKGLPTNWRRGVSQLCGSDWFAFFRLWHSQWPNGLQKARLYSATNGFTRATKKRPGQKDPIQMNKQIPATKKKGCWTKNRGIYNIPPQSWTLIGFGTIINHGCFQKYGKTTKSSLFDRVFHYFHHPFWEFSPYFCETPIYVRLNSLLQMVPVEAWIKNLFCNTVNINVI